MMKTEDCRTDKCACCCSMLTTERRFSETTAHVQNMNREIYYNASPIITSASEVVGAFEIVIDQTDIKQRHGIKKNKQMKLCRPLKFRKNKLYRC
ncbi:MAG: hypothetical protein JXO44_10025 [Clostridia bacterium]|nr:hypothetical protein [Clostridia bacterium]